MTSDWIDPYADVPPPEHPPWEPVLIHGRDNVQPTSDALSTWIPEDLTAYIDGDPDPVQPCLWEREDGLLLLYPGRVHAVIGETESGKSFVMHALVADILRRGGRACIIDYESVAATVIPRIKAMGVSGQQIADQLWYLRPETPPWGLDHVDAWMELCDQRFDLIVLDGVNEGLATMSVSMIDNDEFTKWQRDIPRKLAETTGAPVVLIDHVTKSVEGRGRFAIGAQAKMSTLGGVSYMLEVVQPLGRGVRGELLMWIGKDREGAIRPNQVDYNPKTRMGKIASIIVDSTGPRTYVTVNPPAAADGSGRVPDARAAEHKLAPLMESISERLLESVSAGNTAPLKTSLLGMVIGNKGDKDNALALLEQEGYVKVQADGRAKHVKWVRAYWRAEARKTVERTLLDVPEED